MSVETTITDRQSFYCSLYPSELCVPVASASGCQHLRSASTGLIQVPRARTTIGRQNFTVAGPSLWNSLPAALRRPEMTLNTFRRQLKAIAVPHLMCWQTEGTFITARRCCDVFHDSDAGYKTADLLTYLLNKYTDETAIRTVTSATDY